MEVAPFESCVRCFRGDTRNAVFLHGEAEWHAAFLHVLGIPSDQAIATVEAFAEQELGCRPGEVPAGRFTVGHRLCADCAGRSRKGAMLTDLAASEATGRAEAYVQPEGLKREEE